MNSQQLCAYVLNQFGKEFSKWNTYNAQTLKNAPKQVGVYVLRKAGNQCFGRLNGESDILYIGKTSARGGLRKRLRIYLYKSITGTNKRIHDFAEKTKIEVAWCLCDKPKHLEYDFLWKYFREHDELPPLNYSIIRRLEQYFSDEGKGTDKEIVAKS